MITQENGHQSCIRGLAAKALMHLKGLTASQKSAVRAFHNNTCNNLKLQGVAANVTQD
ncbi:hypothetical protein [Mesorhizobium sp. CN2-181]|uniref:hypothetical protein n=1 Tax=Mesorhizobium yinganensis TaxID=3157707 RepID=UPI0032B85258